MKKHFYLLWGVCTISLYLIAINSSVQAQSIQIDGTTPTTPGQCTGNCNIDGGLQSGNNLFHSFSRFNVDEEATVLFLDRGAKNILTRVTGNQPSNILGTLGVLGNANLFLINPNGIIFGPNAKLNVKASFIGTTANAIQFGDRGFFRASVSEVPLLTVNPSALLYQNPQGVIQNNSIAPLGVYSEGVELFGLRVPDGQSLLLVGGEVKLDQGGLNALGGRVELGGLAESGVIGLDIDNNNFRLSFPENTALADVLLSNGAKVDVTANGGGSITVNARNIGISGNKTRLLSGISQGTAGSQAGDITLNATGALTLTNGSKILNRVLSSDGQSNSGNINIKAGSLSLSTASQVQATTFDTGNAGEVNIDVSNGAITVVGKESRIDSTVGDAGKGNSGNINIKARELYIKDGAFINAGTFAEGNAGNIFIDVADIVSLESTKKSGIFSNVSSGGVGNGGEINIKTRSLSLTGGTQIGTSVISQKDGRPGGRGIGGNITVNASDSVTISGTSFETGFSSGLFAATEAGAVGKAGDITIKTPLFSIANGGIVNTQTLNQSAAGSITINAANFEAINGGQIISSTANSGKAGNIIIKDADRIILSGSDPTFAQRREKFPAEVQNEGPNSGLFANTRRGSIGSGGNIAIETKEFIAQDLAQVSVSSQGTGDAGNIVVNTQTLRLSDRGKITSETESGKGGNINFQIQDLLLMRRNSQISTDAGKAESPADAGNITINALNGFVVAAPLENNDITANAFGNSGKIAITTKRIFGLVLRTGAEIQRLDPENLNPGNIPTSDITSFSRQNPLLSSLVGIILPNFDLSKGLTELPVNVVNASRQIAADCNASGKGSRSSFTVMGRGGVASNPVEPLTADTVLVDWISLEPNAENSVNDIKNRAVSSKQRNQEQNLQKVNSAEEPSQIVEAQGWIVDADGNVVLVAQIPTVTPHKSAVVSASCAVK
ncbi:MAG: filamentous hemagglutinin N-terminal domain-containing protein [Nostoc sp. ChiSLP02]|nr:filamentous hemagglutinin N-terminal domain-containing protein [Nostoc sp. DedSLP05]MDZ8098170.1 filamentous hemagglutinin N-terminal domain-containing protein [Nostoc sp. DedSLP01]MDZ8184015.1 filamentous hemagglutinin N-terminal domain-containing protein [Nostoc sp. ChiSLP02]